MLAGQGWKPNAHVPRKTFANNSPRIPPPEHPAPLQTARLLRTMVRIRDETMLSSIPWRWGKRKVTKADWLGV